MKLIEPLTDKRFAERSSSGVRGAPAPFARGYSPRIQSFEIFDSQERVRLARVRALNDRALLTLDELREIFDAWVSLDEGMVLSCLDLDTFERRHLGVKCAKRGNEVYAWRLNQRLADLATLADSQDVTFFDAHERKPKTRCLFVTLTYDTKRCTRREAWASVGLEWNRWISRLRRRYGRISHLRAWEAFENGYPHIHALLVFESAQFAVFNDGAEWRIQEKAELEGSWHSFVDVSAVQRLSQAARYLVKYLTKVHERGSEAHESKHETTLALMWLYRKRAFGLSKDLVGQLARVRLDSPKHNSNRSQVLDLLGLLHDRRYEWAFLGVHRWTSILACRQGACEDRWHYELTDLPPEALSYERGLPQHGR